MTGFGTGGHYSDHYPDRYDVERAEASPEAARERDRWEILVRDRDRNVAALVDDFSTATFVVRASLPGAWFIELPRSCDAAEALLDRQAGIIALRNGEVVLSGPVRERTRSFDNGESTLTASGPDDFAFLADHATMPQPAKPEPPYELQAYDVRTGFASALIAAYINANAGSAATARRRVVGLTATDPGLGSTLSQRARYQDLGLVLRTIARRSQPRLEVRVRQVVNTSTVAVEIFAPVDRTVEPNRVAFSVDLGNVKSYEYTETAGANWIIAGGEGQGTNREIVESDSPDQIDRWGLIERFVDHRDTSTTVELLDAIRGDLLELGEQTSFQCELTETQSFRFMDDFDIGDLVSVVVDGVELVEGVQEVEVKLDTELAHVTPRVASPGAKLNPNESRIFDAVSYLRRRTADLERTL